MNKDFEVHISVVASDFIRVEAKNKEEAIEEVLKLFEEDAEYLLQVLRNSIQYVEIPNDVKIEDVIEVG